MKKLWKLFGTMTVVIFVLGLVCIGAGVITGAEGERIMTVLDNRFQLESTMNLYAQYFEQFRVFLAEIF